MTVKNTVVEENVRLRKLSEEFSLLENENFYLKENLKEINRTIEKKIKEKNRLIEKSEESLKNAILDLEDLINKNILLENLLKTETYKNNVLNKKVNNIQKKYDSLSNSKLGSLTIKYWNYRKKEH